MNKISEIEMEIDNNHANIAGIVVQKKGAKIYENYFNGYDSDNAVHVCSVTKSILSALIGIAIDQAYIKNIDQKVLDFFPDYSVKVGEKTIQKITLKHLLTMTAPYKYQTEPYELFFTSQNPVWEALDLLGGNGDIGKFHYSAIGGPHILAGILTKATGQSILDFANEQLFFPLEITVPENVPLGSQGEHLAKLNDKNTNGWVTDPQGINTGSWGLFLTPEDMAKIGQLYLDGGKFKDQSIVPVKWVEESTKSYIQMEQIGYGYLWWFIDDESYAALGDYGNVIYVNQAKNMVVSIAALLTADVADRIEFIKTVIEPVFELAAVE